MALYVINPLEYQKGPWHQYSKSLIKYKPKHTDLFFLETIDQAVQVQATEKDALFVNDTNSHYIGEILNKLYPVFGSRIIIMCNVHQPELHYDVSTICESQNHAVSLMRYLKHWGKCKPALYGVNMNSAFDVNQADSYVRNGGTTAGVFYNTKSFESLFQDFLPHIHRFDSVICTHDYAAISLVRYLKEIGRADLYVASCGNSLLAEKNNPSITSVSRSITPKAVFEIYDALTKLSEISIMHMYVKSTIIPRQTTEYKVPPATHYIEKSSMPAHLQVEDSNRFFYYNDAEVDEMIRMEKVLSYCDSEDNDILEHILKGKTTQQLADHCFISLSGMKYRLKSIYQIAGVNNRVELEKLLVKFLKYK